MIWLNFSQDGFTKVSSDSKMCPIALRNKSEKSSKKNTAWRFDMFDFIILNRIGAVIKREDWKAPVDVPEPIEEVE